VRQTHGQLYPHLAHSVAREGRSVPLRLPFPAPRPLAAAHDAAGVIEKERAAQEAREPFRARRRAAVIGFAREHGAVALPQRLAHRFRPHRSTARAQWRDSECDEHEPQLRRRMRAWGPRAGDQRLRGGGAEAADLR